MHCWPSDIHSDQTTKGPGTSTRTTTPSGPIHSNILESHEPSRSPGFSARSLSSSCFRRAVAKSSIEGLMSDPRCFHGSTSNDLQAELTAYQPKPTVSKGRRQTKQSLPLKPAISPCNRKTDHIRLKLPEILEPISLSGGLPEAASANHRHRLRSLGRIPVRGQHKLM